MKVKQLKTVVFLLSFFMLLACGKDNDSCYDPELEENHSGICLAIYDPVCGCDGNTYGNDCEAASKGIKVVFPGPCQ